MIRLFYLFHVFFGKGSECILCCNGDVIMLYLFQGLAKLSKRELRAFCLGIL